MLPTSQRWTSSAQARQGGFPAALRIKAAQIAKPLVLRVSDRHVLLIACGDARVNNNKAKALFNGKLRFVAAEVAAILTGHVPGGMCPLDWCHHCRSIATSC
jgi:prolyl-tRNA editing enzyme YbaK/EbsC (Cys-tRNA(Pro) deacylase)